VKYNIWLDVCYISIYSINGLCVYPTSGLQVYFLRMYMYKYLEYTSMIVDMYVYGYVYLLDLCAVCRRARSTYLFDMYVPTFGILVHNIHIYMYACVYVVHVLTYICCTYIRIYMRYLRTTVYTITYSPFVCFSRTPFLCHRLHHMLRPGILPT